jgi:hypothetical protein
MTNHRIILIFLFLNALTFQIANGQNINDSTFRWFFKNASSFYGNISLNPVYSSFDTSNLKKIYPTELGNEFTVIRKYKMRLVNLDIDKLDHLLFRMKTKEEFYNDRQYKVNLSDEDSIILAKGDKLHAVTSSNISNEAAYDSLIRVQNLLLGSTFDQIFRDKRAKAQPKHMTVLSIFETENMYLIIYHFMMLQGHPHYYVKSDLILK